jgi:hypothetical protein
MISWEHPATLFSSTGTVSSHTSGRNMLPGIPQELSDIILDFLHNDVAALCSAGLVCRSWLPSSRFHLFSKSEIVIKGPDILELICAEGSTIPPYILDLGILGVGVLFETLLRLPLLNIMLRNLSSLNLSHFTVRNCLSRYPSIHFVSSAILEQFETVDQAVDFIAFAPCLEVIEFWAVCCSENSNYSSKAVAPPLRQLNSKPGPLLDNIMDWFCRCHPTPSVHTLEIYQLAAGDNLCNFIRYLGSALENLTIWDSGYRQLGRQSKCIPERYFISLITFISCHKQTN